MCAGTDREGLVGFRASISEEARHTHIYWDADLERGWFNNEARRAGFYLRRARNSCEFLFFLLWLPLSGRTVNRVLSHFPRGNLSDSVWLLIFKGFHLQYTANQKERLIYGWCMCWKRMDAVAELLWSYPSAFEFAQVSSGRAFSIIQEEYYESVISGCGLRSWHLIFPWSDTTTVFS